LFTPRNNLLFDVVDTDPDDRRSVTIQVKTRSVHNTQGWTLGTDTSKGQEPPGLLVILVDLEADGLPELFIYEYPVLPERVAQIYHAKS
jgi:hypothetical protein